MKWRLIVPYIAKERYKDWVEELSKNENVKLIDHGALECENPSESIMYFHLESSKLFFELYKMCTQGYVEVDCFKDMPTVCPDRKRSGGWPGFQEWFMLTLSGVISND